MLIMNRRHPRWAEFLSRLEGPEGCGFQLKKPGDLESVIWTCKGRKNKDKAIDILRTMEGVSIPRTLKYFEKHGGFCDCTILLNVPYDHIR